MTTRALNRATLARQLLLARSGPAVPAAVTHLAGLQAQTTQSWYVGLWSRLAGFSGAPAGQLLIDRALVRIVAMRATIHLVTADDARWLRPLTQIVHDRSVQGAFGRHVRGLDRAEVTAVTRELVAGGPIAFADLRAALAARYPGRDPAALAETARSWLPLVQTPPRGVFGAAGSVVHADLAAWTGAPLIEPGPDRLDDLVLRYLAAYGPATVRDVQQWCGLTRLAEVLDRLRPRLLTFTDPHGRELFDLPGAPRPAEDTPAPVRFLYDFDNLLLSHADRSRMVGDAGHHAQGFGTGSNEQPSTVLIDGTAGATWKILRTGRTATLRIRPFRRLTGPERDDLHAEGAALLAFAAATATTHEVTLS
jgi:hypothetical protein